MNKLKLLSIFVSIIPCICAKAQVTVKIGKDGYFINSIKIKDPVAFKTLTQTLGDSYRIFEGPDTIYTYDQLGLRLYQPPETNTIAAAYIDFTVANYKFSPKQVFSGSLIINGYQITKKFTRDSLGNIPSLFFLSNSLIKQGYAALTFNDVLTYFLFNADRSIASVRIWYAKNKGEFEKRSQQSDAHSTYLLLDFKYESGAFDAGGKKAGVWEYYDGNQKLALRYNYDTDAILYQENVDSDFVIWDGENWKHSKLDIYPQVIAGNNEYKSALSQQIGYPALARSQSIMGRVYVSFVIDKTGKIQHIKLEKDIGGDCGLAVVHALTSFNLSWTHAVKDNISYDSRLMLPVTFVGSSGGDIPTIPPDKDLNLSKAYMLPEIHIVAIGTSQPVKN